MGGEQVKKSRPLTKYKEWNKIRKIKDLLEKHKNIGGDGGGMNWEIGIDIYTNMYKIGNKNLLYKKNKIQKYKWINNSKVKQNPNINEGKRKKEKKRPWLWGKWVYTYIQIHLIVFINYVQFFLIRIIPQ